MVGSSNQYDPTGFVDSPGQNGKEYTSDGAGLSIWTKQREKNTLFIVVLRQYCCSSAVFVV